MDHFGVHVYQLQNEEGADWGYVETDAPESVMKDLWERCWRGQFTEEEERTIIREHGSLEDSGDLEDLVEMLRLSGWVGEQVWVTKLKA